MANLPKTKAVGVCNHVPIDPPMVNKYLKQKIGQLTIRCAHFGNGCEFIGKVEDIAAHEAKCVFSKM